MTRKFRIAPTPSGYLHSGNALNFVLTWVLAKKANARLWLRIDDSDQTRVRDEYLENIFGTLDWLGLDWDEGPESVADFKKNHSQSLKTDYYFEELQKLKKLFACECTRSQLKDFSSYPKTCANKNLGLERGKYAFRIETDDSWDIAEEFHHCILWRKDDLPAYQWVSLIEDSDNRVTDLVRGQDLFESTRFQLALSKRCQVEFGSAKLNLAPFGVVHHRLIEDEGRKLSKSQNSPALFEKGKNKDQFFRETVSTYLKISTPVSSAQELLALDENYLIEAMKA